MTEKEERLLAEKMVAKKGLSDPFVQQLLLYLQSEAAKCPEKMIRSYDERERNRIQALYEVLNDVIPHMIEVRMNFQAKQPWTFKQWLSDLKARFTRAERT